ncbi:MAG: ferritin [Bacteroidales bacterium]|jgi:ferritin|nr:ferritin [Bacteroidales bacterium]MCI2121934.1 ferritin [Bacteroidales bacterium]MCI2145465.1 ferritin [Bacteroidales bacterium]
MLDKKIADLINQQVNKEFYSAYLYMDFSNYYYDQGLDGYGNWFKVQYQEERDHAILMNQYLLNNSYRVTLEAVAKPDMKITCIKDPLIFSLQHEQYVTGLINSIYEAARQANDFRTMQFLDWFVKEQGEEEKNSENNIKRYELFGDDPKGLYQLDSEMGTRIYAAPSLVI